MAGESTLIVTTRTGVRPLGVRGEPLHNSATQIRGAVQRLSTALFTGSTRVFPE